MAEEFTPITTQEELNKIIGERLTRNTQSVTAEMEEKYKGYIKPEDFNTLSEREKAAQTAIAEKNAEIEKLKAENSKYVTNTAKMRIAKENGLPLELADRITGDTEEAMGKDAALLAKLITPTAPMGSTEKSGDSKNEMYKKLLKDL